MMMMVLNVDVDDRVKSLCVFYVTELGEAKFSLINPIFCHKSNNFTLVIK